MPKSSLRDMVIINLLIMLQCFLQLFGGLKASLLDYLAYPAVKPFYHAVCLGVARRDWALIMESPSLEGASMVTPSHENTKRTLLSRMSLLGNRPV